MKLGRCDREEPLINLQRVRAETNELHHLNSAIFDVRADGLDGDLCCRFRWISIDTCADGRKRDGARSMLLCQFQTAPVAASKKLWLVLRAAVPYRTNSMKDPFGWKPEAGSGLCIASGTAVQFAAGFEQFRPSCAVNCAVYASAAKQRGIGCVHNGINLKSRDIA